MEHSTKSTKTQPIKYGSNDTSLRYAFCLNLYIRQNLVDFDFEGSNYKKGLYEIEQSSLYSGFVFFHHEAVSPCRRRWIRLAHFLLGPSLLWLPETKDGRHVFVRLSFLTVVSTVFPSGQRSPTVLFLPFSPLPCIEHLLEQLDDNLKGLLGVFQVLILVLLRTSTISQGSIVAAIFDDNF